MRNNSNENSWPLPAVLSISDRIQITLPIEEMGIDVSPIIDEMSNISWIKVLHYSRGHPLSQYPLYPSIYFHCEAKAMKTLCEVLNAAECDFAWEYCFYDLFVTHIRQLIKK